MKWMILAVSSLAGLLLPSHASGQIVVGRGNGYAYGHGHGNTGYGVGGCPPGLRDKGCMPPGQAKKLFNRGQRFNTAYGTRYAYGEIPRSIRNQYDLTGRYRYYYDNGYLYQVNPRTMIVQQVISALLR